MKEGGRKQGAAPPCAGCKLLRRRCAPDCVFAPYFPAEHPHKFANIHRIFGASNVNKMLKRVRGSHVAPLNSIAGEGCQLDENGRPGFIAGKDLPVHQRSDAVSSLVYEANARVRDPVYGCVGAISSLQQQIDTLQTQLALAQAEVVRMRMRQFTTAPPTQPTTTANSPDNGTSCPSSSKHMVASSQSSRSLFSMDMVVDHASIGESLWSY